MRQRSARNQGPAGAPRRRCLGCHGYSSWPPFAASSSGSSGRRRWPLCLSRCIFCIEPELSPAPKPLIVAPESACQTLPPLGLREQPEPWTGASRCHGALPPAGFSAPRARSVHPQPPSLGSRLPCLSPPVRRPWPSSTYSRHGSRPRCFPDSSESVRSVRIRSTTSCSSTSRISCFMDSFFFQAGYQQDDHFPGSHYYHCHARCFSFIVSRYLPLVV